VIKKLLPFLVFISCSAFAFECCFPLPTNPWNLEGQYRFVGKAKFRDHARGHLLYSDAYGALSYTQFLNMNHLLTYQVGNSFVNFNWNKNPRFKQKSYNNVDASLTYTTTFLRPWRWIAMGGASVDATTFEFGRSGVYYGLLWGRYQTERSLGLHVGVFGFGGLDNGLALPVLGLDWSFLKKWKVNLVFPLDFSIEYQCNQHFSATVNLSSFGGAAYCYPYRIHKGIGRFKHGIFEAYSKGVDFNLNFTQQPHFTAGIGAGWNFGGWILIKDSHNRHGNYYKFNSAPYGQASVALVF
jgi:hypothetical protein